MTSLQLPVNLQQVCARNRKLALLHAVIENNKMDVFYCHKKVVTLLAILALIFCGCILAQRRVSYGDTCNSRNRCDSRASLACRDGKCECIMADTMRYDSRYGRCSVLAGEKCIYTAVETETRSNERSWREEMPCVNNAVCQDGFCSCYPTFYEGMNGTCEIKKGHREDCASDAECRDDQFMVCTDEKACDCHKKTSSYDFSRQSCVRKAGQPCSDLQICVNNAYCRQPRNAEFVSGVICECEDNYFADEDGNCKRKRGFGESCKTDDYCRSDYTNLTCNSEGKCDCNANISRYDNSTNMCRRLAGAPCHGYPYCVENSECGRSGYYEFDLEIQCECNSDYFQSASGDCVRKKSYLEECARDDNCQRGLKCVFGSSSEGNSSGTCQCDTTKSTYDSLKAKCVGLANSTCESSDDCITNSECSWSREDMRRCKCITGYAPSSNGSCLASYSRQCSSEWTASCNKEQGLICKEGECLCKYEAFQSFDTSLHKCVSSVGGPCDESIPCTFDSHCKSENRDGFTSSRCQCNEGFIEVNGKCQLTIGQPCNYPRDDIDSSKPCDTVAPLFCIEGKCQCDYLKTYDKNHQTCRGLVGATCDTKATLPSCVTGAICVKRRTVTSEDEHNNGICKCKPGKESRDGLSCTTSKKTSSKRGSTLNETGGADSDDSYVIDKSLLYK